jgi:hypothetical protein
MNKQSQGLYVKAHIDLGQYHTAAHFDPNMPIWLSVAGGPPIPDALRQITGNGIDVSFSRQDVHNEAPVAETVEFRLTGMLIYGCGFEGVDQVRVIQEGKIHTSEDDSSTILDDAPRGNVDNLVPNGGGDLGPATCLPNYPPNFEFTKNTDSEIPQVGEAFFYLFKFCNGVSGRFFPSTPAR